jgi:hypothetical protein
LKPGVTHEAANAALQPLQEQFARDMPKHFPEHFKVQVEGLNEWVLRRIGGTLYLMFGAVMLLLAIGCGNVSILLLARRRGSSSRPHCAPLLTESLLLAAVGAALGVLTSAQRCCVRRIAWLITRDYGVTVLP